MVMNVKRLLSSLADGMVNRYDHSLVVRLRQQTKLLYNVCMCFLSAGLLVYCWRRNNTFLDSSVLSLSALLLTYLIPTDLIYSIAVA
jgi:hypothetical protein